MKEKDIKPTADTMRVVVIGDNIGLPNGFAPTSRLTLLAASLKGDVKDIEIIIATPSEFYGKAINAEPKGFVKNIQYKYSCNTVIYSKHSIVRRIQSMLGILYTSWYIVKNYRNDTYVVLAYVRKVQLLVSLSIVTKLTGGKLVLELCEWQEALPTLNWFTRLNNKLFSLVIPNLVDGVICISDLIYDKLKKTQAYQKEILKLIKVPILCDPIDFSEVSEKPNIKESYLMFSGNFSYEETIIFILESFSILIATEKHIKLYISGASTNPIYIERIKNNIDRLGLTQHINILGYVDRDDLINYYRNASCLLIPLFNDEVSNARFPTKLAEYLLSGVPVITNKVGEVNNVLTDSVSAYLADAGNVAEYATAIQRALNDQNSHNVAKQGRLVALHHFDYKTHGKNMSNFFEKLY